jgi:hypothetical protein
MLNGLALHFFQRQFSFLGKFESFQTARGIRRTLEKHGFGEITVFHEKHFLVTAQAR